MVPKLLLIPLLVGFLTQVIKLLWHTRAGTLSWRAALLYGGMPSAHTAMMVSLVTVVGMSQGIFSATFAIAAVVSILVIRDAVGFRRYLGHHSRALNTIVNHLPEKKQEALQHFREQLGHTPLEVFVGAVFGFSLSATFYLLIP